tara:strand:- start:99 stop:215 length:117 start_codon:yes stop_codon:yes gene_type:complete
MNNIKNIKSQQEEIENLKKEIKRLKSLIKETPYIDALY